MGGMGGWRERWCFRILGKLEKFEGRKSRIGFRESVGYFIIG